MGAKVIYAIVGRYMNGKEVTGYQLQDARGKSRRFTKEQVYYLAGKEVITNCTGQIYEDKVILKGKGMSLNDLPIADERSGEIRNTSLIGRVKKGKTQVDAMNQYMIVGKLTSGGKVVGYVIRNAGGAIRRTDKNTVLEMAKEGKIGNARVQMYNGMPLLRGVGENLNNLPCEEVRTLAKAK